jgi:hypothetical protein
MTVMLMKSPAPSKSSPFNSGGGFLGLFAAHASKNEDGAPANDTGDVLVIWPESFVLGCHYS